MMTNNLTELLIPWEKTISPGLTLRGWRSPPSGKDLIHFTHGNGLCCLAYEPFLSHLVETYDLFLYDIQGHGNSDAGEQFIGWDKTADALHAIWQDYREDYGKVSSIGLGHSLGGVMTLLRASRYPDDFSRLCLLDPVFLSPFMIMGSRLKELFGLEQKRPLAEQARRRRNSWPNEEIAYKFFRLQYFFKSWDASSLQAYIKHGLERRGDDLKLKCPPDLEASIFDSVPKQLWPAINKLNTKTHILYGSKTYPFIQESIARAKRKNSFIDTEQVRGDHCFVQTNPSEISEKVQKLIKEDSYAVASSI